MKRGAGHEGGPQYQPALLSNHGTARLSGNVIDMWGLTVVVAMDLYYVAG